MRKVRLIVEELEVDSFHTGRGGEGERGTVKANGDTYTTCTTANSDATACNDVTCIYGCWGPPATYDCTLQHTDCCIQEPL